MEAKSVFDDVDLILNSNNKVRVSTPEELIYGGMPTEERVRLENTECKNSTE